MSLSIPADVSDLFFNRDHDGARLKERDGSFAGYDRDALETDAADFLASLSRLGVRLPRAGSIFDGEALKRALVDDFLARL